MQYLSIFLISLYVFGGIACFAFCGIKSAFLTLAIVMFFSHNIATYLCCCNVDCFILIVAILTYDCKPALNTVVNKLYVVGTCKP